MNPKLCAMLLFTGTLALAQSDSALLLSDCSNSSDVKRVLQSSDVVVVRHSFAGYSETCYSVSIAAETGDVVYGFLLGTKHPAVIRFEHQEENYIAQVLPGPGDTRPVPKPAPKTAARPKPHKYKLWNPFSSSAGTK